MTGEEVDKSISELWKLFKETDKRFNETDTQIKETERIIKESSLETERIIKESSLETDRRIKESSLEIEKLSKEIKEAKDLFVGQWGKFVEALVEPGALKLFQERGRKVTASGQRIKAFQNGDMMEIDILLSNSEEVVFIEVKSNLKVNDVKDAVKSIKKFKVFMPVYRGFRVYGAVAGINMEEGADRYAYKQGLYVIKAGTEGLIRILNGDKFSPYDFG